jgi:hypothetical protein
MGKQIKTHYIGKEWESKFIIAKSNCGVYWKDCDEFSSEKKYVTCKKCLKTTKNKQNERTSKTIKPG